MGSLWVSSVLFVPIPFPLPSSFSPQTSVNTNVTPLDCDGVWADTGVDLNVGNECSGLDEVFSPSGVFWPSKLSESFLYSFRKTDTSKEYGNRTVLTLNSLNRCLTAPFVQGTMTEVSTSISIPFEEWLAQTCTLVVTSKAPGQQVVHPPATQTALNGTCPKLDTVALNHRTPVHGKIHMISWCTSKKM